MRILKHLQNLNSGAVLGTLALSVFFAFASCEPEVEYRDNIVEVPPATPYTVTIASSIQNGRLIAVPDKGAQGAVITIVSAPEVYYKLTGTPTATAAVIGEDGAESSVEVPVSGGGAEPYTFTLPAGNVTVSASFSINPSHNPIPITSAADFAKIGADENYPMSGVYNLEADIALTDWNPIGDYPAKPFTGVFNGKNHTVTLNSFIEEIMEKQAVGLFSYIAYAEVKDFTVQAEFDEVTVDQTGDICIGIVAGASRAINAKNIAISRAKTSPILIDVAAAGRLIGGGITGNAQEGGKIESCIIEADMSFINEHDGGDDSYFGGIAGMGDGLTVTNCTYTGSIDGEFKRGYAGGVAGYLSYQTSNTLERCKFEGDITVSAGSNVYAGGIAGGGGNTASFQCTIIIKDCISSGEVKVNSGGGTVNKAGGITAVNPSASSITNCASSSDVTISLSSSGTSITMDAGGIAGESSGQIENCSTSGTITIQCTAEANPTNAYAGGIAGRASNGAISKCYSTAEIDLNIADSTTAASASWAGGIAGILGGTSASGMGTISDCYYNGTAVKAEAKYPSAGGIAGMVSGQANKTLISRCYARGTVTVKGTGAVITVNPDNATNSLKRYTAGGIAGRDFASGDLVIGKIEKCVALNTAITAEGGVSDYIFANRVVGSNNGNSNNGVLANNFANSAMTIKTVVTAGATTGPATVVDDTVSPENMVNGKAAAAAPPQSVYEGLGWTFGTVWKMDTSTGNPTSGYPVLAWQN